MASVCDYWLVGGESKANGRRRRYTGKGMVGDDMEHNGEK